MITREQVADPKRRILMVCVQMFIEKGFKATTMMDIIREADVSSGTFQNLFRTKDGVLLELINFMFKNQFEMARSFADKEQNSVGVYAVETALQLSITESDENLREIYVEAYTQPKLSEVIYQYTSTELFKTFGRYNPDFTESDFYECEIGSAGMMRAFMARPCDKYFTLKRKIEKFLDMSLKAYNTPAETIDEALNIVGAIDLNSTAQAIMNKLFSALEMVFGCKFN